MQTVTLQTLSMKLHFGVMMISYFFFPPKGRNTVTSDLSGLMFHAQLLLEDHENCVQIFYKQLWAAVVSCCDQSQCSGQTALWKATEW